MSPPSAEPADDDGLNQLVAEYLAALERGESPDRDALLAAHPHLAEPLRAFFADHDRLRELAGSRPAADLTGPYLDLAAGTTVPYFGDYQLLEVLGRGAMGVVYKARQVSLNRTVALKMVLSGELAGPVEKARFQAEAEAAAGLDHPNIVPVYEVGESGGRPYFTMRYVDGGTLAGRPRGDARTEAATVALIARAVHFAHQRGVLHRDLKPSNVLIDQGGAPAVADFGLARPVGADRSLTATGDVVGTPRYMAPEQAAGRKDLTVAADVYALGVVLYERLTGRPPFDGDTAVEVLRRVREEPPPRPSSVQPGVPRDLNTVCLKCLEKEPAKRYASAEALADDLDRWQSGRPILARPVGPAGRAWRWVRRNPVVAALLAGCVVTLVSGAVVSTLFAVQARQEAGRTATALDLAERREAEGRRRLARSYVVSGNRLLEAGDDLGALVWYAEALKLDQDDPEREKLHRLRLGLMLRHAPRLTNVGQVPGIDFVACTSKVYVTQDRSGAQVGEWATGRPVGRITGPSELRGVTIGRDNRTALAVAGGADKYALRLWDVQVVKPLTPEVWIKPEPKHVELAPDCRRALLHLASGQVAVRDLYTGHEVVSERKFSGRVSLDLAAKGNRLLVEDRSEERDKYGLKREKSTLLVLNATTLKPVGKPFHLDPHGTQNFRLLPDGSEVIAAHGDAAHRHNPVTGARVGEPLPLRGLSRITLADDAPVLALCGDEGVRVFDLRPKYASWGKASGRPASGARFSPDLSRLVVDEGTDGRLLRLYDRLDGRPLSPALLARARWAHTEFSHDGKRLLTIDPGLNRGWDFEDLSPTPLARPRGHVIRISGDGSRFMRIEEGAFQVFDARTGEPLKPKVAVAGLTPNLVGLDGFGSPPHWLDDGGTRALVVGSDGLHFWSTDAVRTRPVPTPDRWVDHVRWSDSRLLLKFWNGDERPVYRLLDTETLAAAEGRGERDCFIEGKRPVLWDVANDREVLLDPPCPPEVLHHRLGRSCLVAVTDAPRTLHVWESQTGKRRYSRPTAAFGSDIAPQEDRIALLCSTTSSNVLSREVQLHVIDLKTGEPCAPPALLPPGTSDVKFGPDGRRLLIWSSVLFDGIGRGFRVRSRAPQVRDAATGQQVTPDLPEGEIFAPPGPFSPDGLMLLADGRLHDASTGDPLSPANAFPREQSVFRRDGKGIVGLMPVKGQPGDRALTYTPLTSASGAPEDLLARVELLAGRKVNAAGSLTDLTPVEVLERWRRTKP